MVSRATWISPVDWLLKFSDVGLEKSTVAEVPVQLSVLVDEFLDEVDRRHRLTVLGKTTGKSSETTNEPF